MNDETTRLLNEEYTSNEVRNDNTYNDGTSNSSSSSEVENESKSSIASQEQSSNTAKPSKRRKSSMGNTIAVGAGGFVAGVGAMAATNAAASNTEPELTNENPELEQDTRLTGSSAEVENVFTPEPEQVILANDEGIRYAHVDADNFNDAFAQARAQVGAGGVFEYNGKLYGTYTANEWNRMSLQERADYQSRVNEVAPSHHSDSSHSYMADNNQSTPEAVPTNMEMIAPEPVDNEIHVLGVEAVQDGAGNILNVALVECEGDHALLVDVDNNGTIDVMLHDDNGDGQLQESEMHDISGVGIEVADLIQAQVAGQGDVFYTSNDDMPDYINDADSIMSV